MTNFTQKHAEAKNIFFEKLAEELRLGDFNQTSIAKAIAKAGLAEGYDLILFHDGIREIAVEFEAWQDTKMLQALESLDKPKKVRDQIKLALETRIIGIVPKSSMIAQSGFFLLPANVADGLKTAWNSVDIIWRYAGDESLDFNHYSKRSLLLGVYLSSRTYYFADDSENHEKTREFIQIAIDNIVNIASFKSKFAMPKVSDLPFIRMFL